MLAVAGLLASIALSACSLASAANVSSLAEALTPYAMLAGNKTIHDGFLGTIEVRFGDYDD